jgi:hypothetical protein
MVESSASMEVPLETAQTRAKKGLTAASTSPSLCLVDGMGRWLSVSGADRLMRDGGGEETDTDGWALAVRTEKNRQKQSLLS